MLERPVLIVLVLAGSLAALGGCGGGSDGTTGSSSDLQFCVDETNRYRAMDGRPPIARSIRGR